MCDTPRVPAHGLSIPAAISSLIATLCGEDLAFATTLQSAPPEAIHLQYRAPEGCPTQLEFVTEIGQSTTQLRLVSSGEPARSFEVQIASDGRTGRLTVTDGSERSEKDAHGADCLEVSRLLAFAVSLALDRASTQKRERPEPSR